MYMHVTYDAHVTCVYVEGTCAKKAEIADRSNAKQLISIQIVKMPITLSTHRYNNGTQKHV